MAFLANHRTPRICELLDDLADCQTDLAEARAADEAECARSDIYAIRHSLWLAGWSPEDNA